MSETTELTVAAGSGKTEEEGATVSAPPSASIYAAELRAFLREEAWAIATTANVFDHFLQLHDRAGIAYAVRLLIARMRAVHKAHAMLVALDKEDRPHAG